MKYQAIIPCSQMQVEIMKTQTCWLQLIITFLTSSGYPFTVYKRFQEFLFLLITTIKASINCRFKTMLLVTGQNLQQLHLESGKLLNTGKITITSTLFLTTTGFQSRCSCLLQLLHAHLVSYGFGKIPQLKETLTHSKKK